MHDCIFDSQSTKTKTFWQSMQDCISDSQSTKTKTFWQSNRCCSRHDCISDRHLKKFLPLDVVMGSRNITLSVLWIDTIKDKSIFHWTQINKESVSFFRLDLLMLNDLYYVFKVWFNFVCTRYSFPSNAHLLLRYFFIIFKTWRGPSWGLKHVVRINYLTKSKCLSY